MEEPEIFENQHPLMTYLVLKTIFGHLSLEQLKSIRLVSKCWNEAALPLIVQKCVIKLSSSNSISAYNKCLSGAESESTDLLRSQNYSIKLVEASSEGNSELENPLSLFEQFWKTNRVSIKELSLDLSPNLGSGVLKNTLCAGKETQLSVLKVRILKFFDNHGEEAGLGDGLSLDSHINWSLKTLEYSHHAFDNSVYQFPVPWNYVFDKFRGLKVLRLTGISDLELTEILQQASLKRLDLGTMQILNEHAAPETPTNEHLLKLVELNLKCLENLSLEIGPRIDFLALEALLSKYQKSLKALLLRRFPFEHNRFRLINNLENLQHLNISDRFLPDLKCLSQFPKLSSFQIHVRDYSRLAETDLFGNTSHLKPLPGMTSLTVEPLISLECVRKIIKWFPGLTRLKVRVDDVMARLIFMNLRSLTEIYFIALIRTDNYNLQRVSLTDEGITGIPLPVLKQGNVVPERDRILPYIGDLQGLEKLTIESWHDNTNGITDFSICYGILDLPQLTYVHLERTLVSTQGFELLSSSPTIQHASQT